MSADKRKTILIVFAGVAIVLVAVIAVVSPTFRSEDASGAIGAVQKHRAPQITKADVVLGDEQLRHSQKVQYVDFLNDAAALRSMAENFKAASNARDAKSRFAHMEVGIRAQQKQTLDLVIIAIIGILIGDKDLVATDSALGSNKLAMIAAADSLQATSRNFSLGKASAQDLSNAVLAVRKQLDDVESMENLRLRDAVATLDAKNLASAKKNIAEAEAALNARNTASMARAEAAYAEAMAGEAAVLGKTASALSNNDRDTLGLLAVIANKAEDLESHAAVNMKASLDNSAQTYEALARMKQAVDSFNRDGSFSLEAASIDNRKAEAASHINSEVYAQLGALSAHLRAADAMGSKIRNEALDAQLGQLSRFSGNAAYASMIRNSDEFSMQVKALSNASLNSAKKNVDSLNAQKRGAAATLDNQKK